MNQQEANNTAGQGKATKAQAAALAALNLLLQSVQPHPPAASPSPSHPSLTPSHPVSGQLQSLGLLQAPAVA